jgi:hypothetical protein
MNKRLGKSSILLLLAAVFFMVGGCAGMHVSVGDYPEHQGPYYEDHKQGGGPPPWAPAHGKRAKYNYQYYPSTQIYYDSGRSIYFYFNNGEWQASTRLPGQIQLGSGNKITLAMNTDKPYQYHSQVIKRYPPGHIKNRGKAGKK